MERLGGRKFLSEPGRERGPGRPSVARRSACPPFSVLLRSPRPQFVLSDDGRRRIADELDRGIRRVPVGRALPGPGLRGMDRPGFSGVLGRPPVRLEAVREPRLEGVRPRSPLSRGAGSSLARLRTAAAGWGGRGGRRHRRTRRVGSRAIPARHDRRGPSRLDAHPDRRAPFDAGFARGRALRPPGQAGRSFFALPTRLGAQPRPTDQGTAPPDCRRQAPREGEAGGDFARGRALRLR